MPSKTTPVVRGSDKARTGKESVRKPGSIPSSYRPKPVPKWNVTDYKPPRKISDQELEVARKMFFELDRDGSGSIDAEELGMMLRSLGQNPTDEELKDLIDSVDDGDKDGQIQLREFLKLYTQSLDTKKSGKTGMEDVANVFNALGGNERDATSAVDKKDVTDKLFADYELEVDPDSFGKGDTLTKADLATFFGVTSK